MNGQIMCNSGPSAASSARAPSSAPSIALPNQVSSVLHCRLHAFSDLHFPPTQEPEYVSHIALDIGGSLIKLVYFSPDPSDHHHHDLHGLTPAGSDDAAAAPGGGAASTASGIPGGVGGIGGASGLQPGTGSLIGSHNGSSSRGGRHID